MFALGSAGVGFTADLYEERLPDLDTEPWLQL